MAAGERGVNRSTMHQAVTTFRPNRRLSWGAVVILAAGAQFGLTTCSFFGGFFLAFEDFDAEPTALSTCGHLLMWLAERVFAQPALALVKLFQVQSSLAMGLSVGLNSIAWGLAVATSVGLLRRARGPANLPLHPTSLAGG